MTFQIENIEQLPDGRYVISEDVVEEIAAQNEALTAAQKELHRHTQNAVLAKLAQGREPVSEDALNDLLSTAPIFEQDENGKWFGPDSITPDLWLEEQELKRPYLFKAHHVSDEEKKADPNRRLTAEELTKMSPREKMRYGLNRGHGKR